MAAPLVRRLAVLAAGLAVATTITTTPASAAGTGTVQGRITDERGNPSSVQITLIPTSGTGDSVYSYSTDDGRYSIPDVPVGSYTFMINDNLHPVQYAHRTNDGAKAAAIRVRDGRVTTVNERWLPTSKLVATVLDETTGRPVVGACAYVSSQPAAQACTGSTGVVTIPLVPPGTWSVTAADGNGGHWSTTVDGVVFKRSGTTRITVRLRPAASITATIRDATTKAPVDACVSVVRPDDHGILPRCYDGTQGEGKLVIGPMEPVTALLFIDPLDDTNGALWLGANNAGTGDQRQARVLTAAVGRPVDLGVIETDRAGSISGTVRDRGTGAPVSGTCVYPFALDPRVGGDGLRCSTSTGAYTRTGLGPYEWPILFTSAPNYGYAWQWSGDVPDRFSARKVKVNSGATTTLDAAMVRAGTISGTIRDRSGQPVYGTVNAYNARTGDFAADSTSGDTYQVKGLETQQVKIEYSGSCWYLDKPDFASATPVQVTAGADVPLDLVECAPAT